MSSRNIFRRKSLDKIQSPEQLSEYVAVENPSAWMILLAVAVLLAGICIWGIFGHIDTKLRVTAVSDGEKMVCYVSEDDIADVKNGMDVTVNGNAYTVVSVAEVPFQLYTEISDYAMHIGSLSSGEWVYIVTLEQKAANTGDDGSGSTASVEPAGAYAADIITESVSPSIFVLN